MKFELGAQLRDSGQYRFYYWMNGSTYGQFNAVTQEDPKHIGLMTWGIVEPWTRAITERLKILGGKSLRTQSEFVFENARTDEAILKRRCIIPVTGYFISYDIKKVSYPHLVQPANETYLGLLGVYNVIDGIRYTTILSTKSSDSALPYAAQGQVRPIVLDPYYWKDWLDGYIDEGQIQQLMFQCDTEQAMQTFPVMRDAANERGKNNVPEVLERRHFPELAILKDSV